MAPEFVHLHNHTDYSLLDGAQKIPTLINTVIDNGMDAVGVTEHGNMFSAISFYKKAHEAGIKPIIGSEIYSNPIQHVRLKPPESRTPVYAGTKTVQLGATPWHQDNGVANEDADMTNMLTVWIPIWDASVEDGCLHVVPSSHIEGLKTHCPQSDRKDARGGFGLHIPDKLFRKNDAIPLPMKRGSVLLLNKMTCHGSLPNKSNRIRWSLDLRYNPIGEPTGRNTFPGFIARSKKNPNSELHDPIVWAESWLKARHDLSIAEEQTYNRWSTEHPACA